MSKILVCDGIEPKALGQLKKDGHKIMELSLGVDELNQKIKQIEIVIVRSATKITKEIIDSALETHNLKLIIRAGVGVDNIDVDYAREHGVQVCNTPAASSLAVAELVVGHMFSLARHICQANLSMRQGKWEKNKYIGIELAGKTLGLIGFGKNAIETAKLAKSINMNVIYYTQSGRKEGYDDYQFVPIHDLLAKSDFISMHVPYSTKNPIIIGPSEFNVMKDGVYVINCARGGIIDEKALIRALDSGKVAAAALDVFEHEPVEDISVYANRNICMTPHIGASTEEAQERIGKEIVEIISHHLIQVE